jgi:hypothetical protein
MIVSQLRTEARVQFLALAARISNSATREDHAQCVPKSRLTQTFVEVTAFPPEDCKTVGLAYDGSNPSPATTSGNNP